LKETLAVGLFVIVSVYVAFSVANRIEFKQSVRSIESLRQEVRSKEIHFSDELVDTVAMYNMRIFAYQQYNKEWWADLAIPDDWEKVEMISIVEKEP
jgi:hypothetical protein